MRHILIASRITVLAAFFGALFLACDDSPTGPEVVPMYPLIKGMTWNYQVRSHSENFRPLVSGFTFTPIDERSTERVLLADTVSLGDSLLTWKFVATTTDSAGAVRTAEYYYHVAGNELLGVAFKGNANAYPKQHPGTNYRYGDMTFSSPGNLIAYAGRLLPSPGTTDSLELQYFTPPLKVLVYPLAVGNRWLYRSSWGVVTAKEVTGFSPTVTPAGTFSTALVRWLMNYRPDETYDTNWVIVDAVAPQGLVSRRITFKDMAVVSGDSQEILGLFDFYDDRILTSREFR
jgi:hypothetical protein